MDEVELLKKRVKLLEEEVDNLQVVVNHLLEVVYEPEFIKKIDKLANYGKTDKRKG